MTTFSGPCRVGVTAAPTPLITWSIVPAPLSETVSRSCIRTPGRTGTSKALVECSDGFTFVKM